MKDNLTRIGSQARYHSNRLDQIDRLIHAAEADKDIAYLARLLALCSLPRTNPGNRTEYVRRNGPRWRSPRASTTNSPSATSRGCCWPGCVPKRSGPRART